MEPAGQSGLASDTDAHSRAMAEEEERRRRAREAA